MVETETGWSVYACFQHGKSCPTSLQGKRATRILEMRSWYCLLQLRRHHAVVENAFFTKGIHGKPTHRGPFALVKDVRLPTWSQLSVQEYGLRPFLTSIVRNCEVVSRSLSNFLQTHESFDPSFASKNKPYFSK